MSAIGLFSLLSVVLALGVYLVKRKFAYWRDMGVPYDEPDFPHGNIKGVGREFHQSQLMERLYGKMKDFGSPFVGLFFYLSPVVLVTSLDFVKTVMVRDAASFIDRGAYYNEEDGE